MESARRRQGEVRQERESLGLCLQGLCVALLRAAQRETAERAQLKQRWRLQLGGVTRGVTAP